MRWWALALALLVGCTSGDPDTDTDTDTDETEPYEGPLVIDQVGIECVDERDWNVSLRTLGIPLQTTWYRNDPSGVGDQFDDVAVEVAPGNETCFSGMLPAGPTCESGTAWALIVYDIEQTPVNCVLDVVGSDEDTSVSSWRRHLEDEYGLTCTRWDGALSTEACD